MQSGRPLDWPTIRKYWPTTQELGYMSVYNPFGMSEILLIGFRRFPVSHWNPPAHTAKCLASSDVWIYVYCQRDLGRNQRPPPTAAPISNSLRARSGKGSVCPGRRVSLSVSDRGRVKACGLVLGGGLAVSSASLIIQWVVFFVNTFEWCVRARARACVCEHQPWSHLNESPRDRWRAMFWWRRAKYLTSNRTDGLNTGCKLTAENNMRVNRTLWALVKSSALRWE
jgi:hypothetical protein